MPDPDVARERVAAALANGSGGTLGSVLEKPRADNNGKRASYGGNDLPTRKKIIAELQRIAMGGMMPSMDPFNANRPANWSTASVHVLHLHTSWESLAEEAGLKPRWTRR